MEKNFPVIAGRAEKGLRAARSVPQAVESPHRQTSADISGHQNDHLETRHDNPCPFQSVGTPAPDA
ncbi:hypothetical protein, partial [Delftia sp. ZNC0008]|uniref:hypothetical protein n=1 Tax=Delftia sp. ZNC0008 TaxID=1339242 RepID=UPI001E4612FF